MTINIALATYDGIILGCDSLSSVVDKVIFPFGKDCEFAKHPDGSPMLDTNGRPMVSVVASNMDNVATTVFGGVNKVFCLYEDVDTCVAALTSGMATLGDVTIAQQAKRYRRKCQQNQISFNSVQQVADDFLRFMRQLWEKEFEGGGRRNQALPSGAKFPSRWIRGQ